MKASKAKLMTPVLYPLLSIAGFAAVTGVLYLIFLLNLNEALNIIALVVVGLTGYFFVFWKINKFISRFEQQKKLSVGYHLRQNALFYIIIIFLFLFPANFERAILICALEEGVCSRFDYSIFIIIMLLTPLSVGFLSSIIYSALKMRQTDQIGGFGGEGRCNDNG